MKRVLFWFRKGLRLHDNPSLLAALEQNPDSLIPIYILDPKVVFGSRIGLRRWIFLLESLKDLDKSLRKLKSRLFVIRASPIDIFPTLLKEWKPSHVYYELIDNEPQPLEDDSFISGICTKENVSFVGVHGHTLFQSKAVIDGNKGKIPLTYTSFLKSISGLQIPKSMPSPAKLPKVGDYDFKTSMTSVKILPDLDQIPVSETIDIKIRREFFSTISGKDFEVPEIHELGYSSSDIQSSCSPHHGGETEALRILEEYFQDKVKVAKFEKPNTSPAAFKPADTTVLSPHMSLGTLSCRVFYERIKDVYRQIKNHSAPPVSLEGQVLWREFYYVCSTSPNFDQMKGNPVCLQVDWHLSRDKTESNSTIHQSNLEAWAKGQTGYPWIDAIMNQLRSEGWIHHLARHSVACFLTRGDLYISWEQGAAVFDELLLDSDWALNNGNWMWLRVYSPIAFGKKYDKQGKFIRKYVPALKNMPQEYLFEPWKAPLSVQKQIGCLVGKDYPNRIVDHEVIYKQNMEKMKSAYSRGLKGKVEDVMTKKRKRE